ncbi:hypothetical protein OHT93_19585 [Streptomyces sp. NBC_00191]|uniref:hypothetical protein n=1 Tax=Streptomyces sp. NBC_00191 TaxID=2975674 RepID=UPI003249AD2E
MAEPSRYDKQLDILIALITYMALTRWRSRSPNGLAKDLGLSEEAVTRTLDEFPGIFRKSANFYPTDAGPQNSYTLHARFARRRPRGVDAASQQPPNTQNLALLSDPEPTQDGTGEELDADTLRALLDFVTGRAEAERAVHLHSASQKYILLGAVAASLVSLLATIIQAVR